MWPGPYGDGGSRKYLLGSLDQSLARMGLDHVDIFYSHRFDPHTPLEETMGALDTAVRSGRATYAGISSYSPERTREAAAILRDLGHAAADPPAVVLDAQPLGRGAALLDVLGDEGIGCIAFSPLAQGMLTDRYLDGIPEDSRAAQGKSLDPELLSDESLTPRPGAQRDRAASRGQSLAQMALAWLLRDDRVTSVLIGASSVGQLDDNLAALDNLGVQRRRAGRDRPARGRLRHQPVGDAPATRRLGVMDEQRAQRVVDALARARASTRGWRRPASTSSASRSGCPARGPPSGTATARWAWRRR